MSALLIVGAGGHGLVVADAAVSTATWTNICFLDDRGSALGQPLGFEVIGTTAELAARVRDFDAVAIGIGNVGTRLRLLQICLDLGIALPPIVHSGASVSRFAVLEIGTVVFAQAAINPGAALGLGCIVNTGATIDHGCQLAAGVHVSPGAHLGGDVTVGERTWIGIGANVRHGITIGADVMIGAGAAVVSNIPSGTLAVGVPARIRKHQ